MGENRIWSTFYRIEIVKLYVQGTLGASDSSLLAANNSSCDRERLGAGLGRGGAGAHPGSRGHGQRCWESDGVPRVRAWRHGNDLYSFDCNLVPRLFPLPTPGGNEVGLTVRFSRAVYVVLVIAWCNWVEFGYGSEAHFFGL